MNVEKINEIMSKIEVQYSEEQLTSFSEKFSRDGMLIISDIIPSEVYDELKSEVLRLLNEHNERIDIKLETTDYTPRKMNIITHENMVQHADIIKKVYENESLTKIINRITCDNIINYISDDEGLFVAKQQKSGDTHGWHWGDYSYALIFVMETPPIEVGGMLQCVPHTSWNKEKSNINKYLCENKIDTYGFKSNDIYLLKTDTTLHRTVPLSEDTTRIILNMTWGTEFDKKRHQGAKKDTWWQDTQIDTAVQLEDETA